MGSPGSTTTKQEPWSGAQPYIRDSLQAAQGVFQNPAQYYPGQTFNGPSQGQLGAWNTMLGFNDQVFGGANAPKYGEATNAASQALTGTTNLGNFANSLTGQAQSALGQAGGIDQVANFGTAGSLDARGALQSMLSGTPDYAGAQGAVDAANAPLLRQFNEELLPSLNARTNFMNNPTGGIKTVNRALPELGQRMSQNALSVMEGERQRALGSQQSAANLVTQGGQQAMGQQFQNSLGLGNLAGSMAGQQSGDMLRMQALFPQLYQMGQQPGQLAGQFADWGQNFSNQALQDDMNRWNFYQQQPQDMASWYSQIVNGTAGLGGQTSQSGGGGSKGAGIMGGAMSGATIGSMIPGMTIPGALVGGLMGLF